MDMLVPPLRWQKNRFSAQDAVKLIFSFYGKRCWCSRAVASAEHEKMWVLNSSLACPPPQADLLPGAPPTPIPPSSFSPALIATPPDTKRIPGTFEVHPKSFCKSVG